MIAFKKIISFLIYFYCILFLNTQFLFAQIYVPIDKDTLIQEIILTHKSDIKIALIKMSDYDVNVPLTFMKNADYNRAFGVTPQGLKIGLKFNDILLRLFVIDKTEKNYMVTDFVAKNADSTKIKLSAYYKKPLDKTDIYISSMQFIQSYPLWSPDDTSRGFELLVSKEKGIISLFPAIQLELAEKLCRSDIVTAGIFELLPEDKKISCDDLLIFNNQKHFDTLKKYANTERDLLTKVLECSQGNRQSKSCEIINKTLAQKILESVSIQSLFKKIKNS